MSTPKIPAQPVAASKNGGKTRGQPFKPGDPGGPGRPEGSRNKATVALDKLADGEAEAILTPMLEKAKAGDMRAAEMILARVWPVRKGRPIELELPPIVTPGDVVKALGSVADAVTGGAITPDEGAAVASVLEIKRRAIETVDLASRVAALEKERK